MFLGKFFATRLLGMPSFPATDKMLQFSFLFPLQPHELRSFFSRHRCGHFVSKIVVTFGGLTNRRQTPADQESATGASSLHLCEERGRRSLPFQVRARDKFPMFPAAAVMVNVSLQLSHTAILIHPRQVRVESFSMAAAFPFGPNVPTPFCATPAPRFRSPR